MVFLWRTTAAVATAGLLAACAQSGPLSLVPSAAQNQAPPAGHAAPAFGHAGPARHNPGRVLYVADIDGQPGLGQIHVYTAATKNPQQLRLITQGAGRPFGLWVDSKNVLYVANEANKLPASVTEFKPGASSPFFTITDVKGQPGSVAVDRAGNVYVNENVQDEGWVQVFAPGQNTPERSIDTGIGGYAFDPGSVAFDPQGNLIVAEQAKLALQMVKIAPGSSQPIRMNLDLTNIVGPGMGIDKAGNIYVASSAGASVSVFAPGQTEPSRTISNVPAYGLTWVTADGAVYQASGVSSVSEVAPGASEPTTTIQVSAQGVAVSR
jgi:sugar lactone lactonase YvrE